VPKAKRSLSRPLKKRGRKGMYNQTRVALICNAIAKGNLIQTAAAAAGINKATLYEWKKKYPEFNDAIELAEAAAEMELLNVPWEAATKDKNWRAALELMQRRFRKHWAPSSEKLPPTQPITINFNLPRPAHVLTVDSTAKHLPQNTTNQTNNQTNNTSKK